MSKEMGEAWVAKDVQRRAEADVERKVAQTKCQQACHQRKREKEQDDGKRDENLVVIRRPKEIDADSDGDAGGFVANVAKLSRPQRAIIDEAKRDSRLVEKRGRRKRKVLQVAVRTNWQSPGLWPAIVVSAQAVGWPFSNTLIVRHLVRHYGPMYEKLTSSCLGTWVDRAATTQRGGLVWKEEVLDRVDNRYLRRSGPATNRGILVSKCCLERVILDIHITFTFQESYPKVIEMIDTQLRNMRTAGIPLSVVTV